MAIKKIHYYTLDIENVNNGQVLDNFQGMEILKDEINKLITANCNLTSVIINPDVVITDRVSLDILVNRNNILFGRVGKYKDSSESLVRNMETLEVDSVGDEQTYLEVYTYFFIDYDNGIVGHIAGSSAPNVFSLENIMNNNGMYNIKLGNITSNDTVRTLLTPGSTLGNIQYTYRIPDIRILRHLGLSDTNVQQLGDTEYATVDIIIKNEPRRALASGLDTIGGLINSFADNNLIIKKIFKGRTPNTSMQNFKFEIESYSNTIDIPTSRVENGQIVRYTLDDIAQDVFLRLQSVYNTNRRNILVYANR